MLNIPIKNIGPALLLSTSAFIFSETASATPLFDSGMPSSWTCTGNCGTQGANGVVTLAPSGGSQYGWVSTENGVDGVTLSDIGDSGDATNGSMLRSSVFSAAAGDKLTFQFNFVTSDGGGFGDYAWARLLNSAFNEVALLFTARTTSSGNVVPGFSMPAPSATLAPPTVSIIGGTPQWAPLGGSSDTCFTSGCGYTGWVSSTYTIENIGNYILEFGVANWGDKAYQTGLAFDGISVGGTPIGEVPEPATLALLGVGLFAINAARRRKKAA